MAEHSVTVENTLQTLLNDKKYSTIRDILVTMNPADIAAVFAGVEQEKLPLPEFRLIDGKVFAPSYLRPGVAETYQIPHLEQTAFKIHDLENATGIETGICVPYRMRDFKLTCRIY